MVIRATKQTGTKDAADMENGECGVIVAAKFDHEHIGQILQCMRGDDSFAITEDVWLVWGERNGVTWSGKSPSLTVRPLAPGDVIEVVE